MQDAPGDTTLPHELGDTCVRRRPDGTATISVNLKDGVFSPRVTCETTYPLSLITHILEKKGPAYLCDEIARDQDPAYIQGLLEPDLLAFVSPEEFEGKRILDFGCGSGASTMVLARMFPHTEIIGVELSESLLETAFLRADFYQLPNIKFLVSPSGSELPAEIGKVDYIILSAVFEHLLPAERRTIMPKLWEMLEPGGVMFLDQTPHRWFPVDLHTTFLPLINYMPDKAAHWYARRFSRLVKPGETWPQLLRNGIRGGTQEEILATLKPAIVPGEEPIPLKPTRLGITNQVDLWLAGPSFRSLPRGRRWMGRIIKALQPLTGSAVVQSISVAIRKNGGSGGQASNP